MGGALRGIFGYCFLIFIVRIVGRRPGKQLTPFEFILIFFMGGVALTPMVGNDHSVTNAFVTIMSVVLTHFIIIWLKTRSSKFGRIVDGTPLVLLDQGKWQTEALVKMRITDDDVMTYARDQGLERLDQIEYAVLERNGEVSIVPVSED